MLRLQWLLNHLLLHKLLVHKQLFLLQLLLVSYTSTVIHMNVVSIFAFAEFILNWFRDLYLYFLICIDMFFCLRIVFLARRVRSCNFNRIYKCQLKKKKNSKLIFLILVFLFFNLIHRIYKYLFYLIFWKNNIKIIINFCFLQLVGILEGQ